MAGFSIFEIYGAMQSTGIVPVFYHSDAEVAEKVVKACYKGGVRVFEFTNRGDFAVRVFGQLVEYCARECPGLVLGIGSVIDPHTAALYIQSGANFIVGPGFNREVAKLCNRHLLPYIPGCATVTEISDACEAGCIVVKVFPAGTVGGPAFVQNLRAPLPRVNVMVTGGVEPTDESLTAWFNSGIFSAGIGSQLFPADIIAANDWQSITDKCREAIGVFARARESET